MCQCGDNVKASLLVWRTRYTDTFCNAVDCRFELALEVQRWTRARSECLPGEGGKNYSYAISIAELGRTILSVHAGSVARVDEGRSHCAKLRQSRNATMPQGLTPVVRGTLAAAADDEFDSYVTSSPDATTAENTINTNVEDEKNSGFVHRPDPSHTHGGARPRQALTRLRPGHFYSPHSSDYTSGKNTKTIKTIYTTSQT